MDASIIHCLTMGDGSISTYFMLQIEKGMMVKSEHVIHVPYGFLWFKSQLKGQISTTHPLIKLPSKGWLNHQC